LITEGDNNEVQDQLLAVRSSTQPLRSLTRGGRGKEGKKGLGLFMGLRSHPAMRAYSIDSSATRGQSPSAAVNEIRTNPCAQARKPSKGMWWRVKRGSRERERGLVGNLSLSVMMKMLAMICLQQG